MTIEELKGRGAPNWCLRPGADIRWRRWDDEWAIFDVGSGQTHQMDFLTGVALMQFDEGSVATAEQLSRDVALRLDVESSPELHDLLAASLERLSMAGLVERKS